MCDELRCCCRRSPWTVSPIQRRMLLILACLVLSVLQMIHQHMILGSIVAHCPTTDMTTTITTATAGLQSSLYHKKEDHINGAIGRYRTDPRMELVTGNSITGSVVPTTGRYYYKHYYSWACPDCIMSPVPNGSTTTTCGRLLWQQMREQPFRDQPRQPLRSILLLPTTSNAMGTMGREDTNTTVWAALLDQVAERHPYSCRQCRSRLCPMTRYYRMDRWESLWLDMSHKTTAISHYLDSIPAKHRLPSHAVHDLGQFFTATQPQRRYPQSVYLFEYNPSVVVLPQSQRPTNDAIYLASYRVTAFQYCFKSRWNSYLYQRNTKKASGPVSSLADQEGLVALVLLRHDLTILHEIGIFNVQSILPMQDPRLFVLRDQIYLASYEYLVPLWLVPPPLQSSSPTPSDQVILERYFGPRSRMNSNLTTALPHTVILRRWPSCCVSDYCVGKNFNYFLYVHHVRDTGTASLHQDATPAREDWVMVETQPMRPHIVERIQLNQKCPKSDRTANNKAPVSSTPTTTTTTNSSTVFVGDYIPRPSYETIDTLLLAQQGQYRTPYSPERGTACCIEIVHKGRRLYVGISHIKSYNSNNRGGSGNDTTASDAKVMITIPGRQYLSRWYAFEPVPPFRVVAISGAFCLGFPNPTNMQENVFNSVAMKQPFVLAGVQDGVPQPQLLPLACPKITFVTGLTQAANDPDRVVISYGINDCTGRMIVVAKDALISMLFQS